MKGDFIESPYVPLPQLKEHMSTGRALNLTGLWRDLVKRRELRLPKRARQLCLLSFRT